MPRITKTERDELYQLLAHDVITARQQLQSRMGYRERGEKLHSIKPSKELVKLVKDAAKLAEKEHFKFSEEPDKLSAKDSHPEMVEYNEEYFTKHDELTELERDIKFQVLNYNGDFERLAKSVDDMLKKAGIK